MRLIPRLPLLVSTLLLTALAACTGNEGFKTIRAGENSAVSACPASVRMGESVTCSLTDSEIAFDGNATLLINRTPLAQEDVVYNDASDTVAFTLTDDVVPSIDEKTGERFVTVKIGAGDHFDVLAERIAIVDDVKIENSNQPEDQDITPDNKNSNDEIIDPIANAAPIVPDPSTPAVTPPAAAPATTAPLPLALSLDGTALDLTSFGLVKVQWSVQGRPAKALLYGTSLNRNQPGDGCGKTADGRFLAVNPPIAGAFNLLEGSPNFKTYAAYTSGQECTETLGNCPGHKDDPTAPTVCAIDLTALGAGNTFYTRVFLGHTKFVLAALDANGQWTVTEKEIVLPLPSLTSSVTVSSTEPMATITANAGNASGEPTLSGCPDPKNVSLIRKTDGTSEYHAQCALQQNTTLTITAPGAAGTSPKTDTYQISVSSPRITLTHAGGTCNLPSSTVDWNDPATCEYAGTVKLATQVAYDYEIIKNGVSISKESASWPAPAKFFAGDSWEEIPVKTIGAFAETARDHEHTKFLAEVSDLDGKAVRSGELNFPYKSDFVFDESFKSAATATVEDVNGPIVHVKGEMPWHGRHFIRMEYQCVSKMNPHGVVDGSSENISTDPGAWKSANYDVQTGTFSVESIFPMPFWNPFDPYPALCWKEEIQCTFTAKGHDGRTYTSGPVIWTLTAEQSKLYGDKTALNQTTPLLLQPGASSEQVCKQFGY